jgi:hypothetical protein
MVPVYIFNSDVIQAGPADEEDPLPTMGIYILMKDPLSLAKKNMLLRWQSTSWKTFPSTIRMCRFLIRSPMQSLL